MSENNSPPTYNTDNRLSDGVDIILKLECIIKENKINLEPQLERKLKQFKQETIEILKNVDTNVNRNAASLLVAQARDKPRPKLLKSKSMNAVFPDDDSKAEPLTPLSPSDPFTTTITSIVIQINETLKPIDVSKVHQLFNETKEFNQSNVLHIDQDIFCETAKQYNIEPFQAKRILTQLQSTINEDTSISTAKSQNYSIMITKDPSETSSTQSRLKVRPRIMKAKSLNALQLENEPKHLWTKEQWLKDKDKLDGIMNRIERRFVKSKSMNALQDRDDVVAIQKLKKDKDTSQIKKVSASKDNTDTLAEYTAFFNHLHEKKSKSAARRDKLQRDLLKANTMKRLADCTDDEERQMLMKEKVEICEYICDFGQKWEQKGSICIKNKKDLLSEILQCMTLHKWNNEQLLDQCLKTISKNLFRSLPDAKQFEDVYDRSWDHIQSMHELTYHVVNNTNIGKKTMASRLQGTFLRNLIRLLRSSDAREPEYAKLILHKIYGRFMTLRTVIRQYFSDFCLSYIYLSTYRDHGSWFGIGEILQILAAVFQGLNVPVKQPHLSFVRNVIVPLHKAFHLDEFHADLVCCCITLIAKEPELAAVILGGMLRFWPTQNHAKQLLFITEMVAIIKVCENHPNMNLSDPVFVAIAGAVFNKIVECIGSPHHEVVAHGFMAWNDATIKKMIMESDQKKMILNLKKILLENKDNHWSLDVREVTKEQLELMKPKESVAHDISDDDDDFDHDVKDDDHDDEDDDEEEDNGDDSSAKS